MNKKAFSLIEILISISIIALLATSIFFSLDFARVKARDATRKKDLRTIQNAIQLYINTNSDYPLHEESWTWVLSTHNDDAYSWIKLTSVLVPRYLNAELIDPVNDADSRYRYSYRTGHSVDWDLKQHIQAALDTRLEYPKDTTIGAGVFQDNSVIIDEQVHRIYSVIVAED